MFEYISKTSAVLISIVSLFRISKGTWVESFFRWLYLGPILDLVYAHYIWIMICLIVIFLTRWIKDWRWLLGIGMALVVFFTFAF